MREGERGVIDRALTTRVRRTSHAHAPCRPGGAGKVRIIRNYTTDSAECWVSEERFHLSDS